MLSADHPNSPSYRKDPPEFVRQLYARIKAQYSSLYADHIDDTVRALERLDLALHEGYDDQQLLQKAQQAADLTEQQYRTSCAKFVKDFYWRRTFQKVTNLHPVEKPTPYEGLMPPRP